MNMKFNPDCRNVLRSNLPRSVIRLATLAAFVGGLALAGPLQAAPADTSGDYPQNAMDQTPEAPQPPAKPQKHGMARHGQQDMAQHVEDRIKTLHSKLGITDEQEAKWGEVAQTMRDNETAISQLIKTRHQNTHPMTAVDDLQSYENIAQAHIDGLKKLLPVFQSLYNDLSDDQKKDADEAFGSFEGHRHDKSGKNHK